MLKLRVIAEDTDFIPVQTLPNAGADIKVNLTDIKCLNEHEFLTISRQYSNAYFSGKIGRKLYFNSQSIVIYPGDTHCVPLGFKVDLSSCNLSNEIPYLEIVSRSGLASKGLIVANAPGIIDMGYQDEVKVILYNQSNLPHILTHKDRVAQCLLKTTNMFKTTRVESFNSFNRGGGFGSTGVN